MPADPELHGLVLRHIERRRRDGLRRAVEQSLAHRLLGAEDHRRTEPGPPRQPLPEGRH
ncbi:hypothetical protein ACFQ3Z_20640 [Streptomyces nogalater]